mgnify:CR=1 FL=1
MLKADKIKLSRISEVVADFEEKYEAGEVSSLVNVVDPQWGYTFIPLTENSQGIVLQSTVGGTLVSLAKSWF